MMTVSVYLLNVIDAINQSDQPGPFILDFLFFFFNSAFCSSKHRII